jgi:hypothetical protein
MVLLPVRNVKSNELEENLSRIPKEEKTASNSLQLFGAFGMLYIFYVSIL